MCVQPWLACQAMWHKIDNSAAQNHHDTCKIMVFKIQIHKRLKDGHIVVWGNQP